MSASPSRQVNSRGNVPLQPLLFELNVEPDQALHPPEKLTVEQRSCVGHLQSCHLAAPCLRRPCCFDELHLFLHKLLQEEVEVERTPLHYFGKLAEQLIQLSRRLCSLRVCVRTSLELALGRELVQNLSGLRVALILERLYHMQDVALPVMLVDHRLGLFGRGGHPFDQPGKQIDVRCVLAPVILRFSRASESFATSAAA